RGYICKKPLPPSTPFSCPSYIIRHPRAARPSFLSTLPSSRGARNGGATREGSSRYRLSVLLLPNFFKKGFLSASGARDCVLQELDQFGDPATVLQAEAAITSTRIVQAMNW
ncbi:hypothetical protein Taro_056560, partial [Colocasia esculenta]|nr:hypothetical protein [Colocasia esculenta]